MYAVRSWSSLSAPTKKTLAALSIHPFRRTTGDLPGRGGLVRPALDALGPAVLLLLSHDGEKVRGDVAREVVARRRRGAGRPPPGRGGRGAAARGGCFLVVWGDAMRGKGGSGGGRGQGGRFRRLERGARRREREGAEFWK